MEGGGEGPAPAPRREEPPGLQPAPDLAAELSRIRAAYVRAAESEGLIVHSLKPLERKVAEEAAKLGTCQRWDEDELVAEFKRTIRGLRGKGFTASLSAVVNHVGEVWRRESAGEGTGGAPDFDAAAYRAAIGCEDAGGENGNGHRGRARLRIIASDGT